VARLRVLSERSTLISFSLAHLRSLERSSERNTFPRDASKVVKLFKTGWADTQLRDGDQSHPSALPLAIGNTGRFDPLFCSLLGISSCSRRRLAHSAQRLAADMALHFLLRLSAGIARLVREQGFHELLDPSRLWIRPRRSVSTFLSSLWARRAR